MSRGCIQFVVSRLFCYVTKRVVRQQSALFVNKAGRCPLPVSCWVLLALQREADNSALLSWARASYLASIEPTRLSAIDWPDSPVRWLTSVRPSITDDDAFFRRFLRLDIREKWPEALPKVLQAVEWNNHKQVALVGTFFLTVSIRVQRLQTFCNQSWADCHISSIQIQCWIFKTQSKSNHNPRKIFKCEVQVQNLDKMQLFVIRNAAHSFSINSVQMWSWS